MNNMLHEMTTWTTISEYVLVLANNFSTTASTIVYTINIGRRTMKSIHKNT